MKHLTISFITLLTASAAFGQDTTRRKTIDITSSFKPSLQPAAKLNFNASPLIGDTTRPSLKYQIPVQNLAFSYYPIPLKPLAFSDSLKPRTNGGYAKLGFGNFSTPYIDAGISFGDGIKTVGALNAFYTSSKGKMAHQKFGQLGVTGSGIIQTGNNHELTLKGGYEAYKTYRYGFQPDTLKMGADSLLQRFNHAFAGIKFANKLKGDFGLYYAPEINIHFFNDNNSAKELQAKIDVPLEKTLGEKFGFVVGLHGSIANFRSDKADFNNNLFYIDPAVKVKLDALQLHLGVTPSWNNKEFKLLPNFKASLPVADNKFVAEAGWTGYFTEQTYRYIAGMNPWVVQPAKLVNTTNSEFYAGIKASLDQHFSFRAKVGYIAMRNVPLFANDLKDGRSFEILYEPKMNAINVNGEITYRHGDAFYWTVLLNTYGYGGLKVNPKSYGLVPFELQSSVRAKLFKDFYLTADLYYFEGNWKRNKTGDPTRTRPGFDLNAGVEFTVYKNIKLWLALNNVLNNKYQRWNQYPVLGFQALGGVKFVF